MASPSAEPAAAAVLAVLDARLATPAARGWRADAARVGGAVFDAGAFDAIFAATARHVGRAVLRLATGEGGDPEIARAIDGRGLDEVARVALLLLAAARLTAPDLVTLVERTYARGDNRERQAVLRALGLLPVARDLLAIALDACRSSVRPLLEAIACENGYPVAWFHALHFEQMVLKAVVAGVAIGRIVGLEARLTPELVRMARDHARERRAAGRPVPAGLRWLAERAEVDPVTRP